MPHVAAWSPKIDDYAGEAAKVMVRLVSLTVAAMLLAGLTACSGTTEVAAVVAPSPTASRAMPKADPAILETAVRGWLAEVDPGLDAHASVADADNVCSYVAAGESSAVLRRAVKARFAARADHALTRKKLTRIVHILSTNYCPRT